MIKVKSLVKEYSSPNRQAVLALKGIDLNIKEGEFVAVMGPSGSGKTTLLNCLGGMDDPTSGDILLNNKNFKTLTDVEKTKLRRKNIGFVFQFFNLIDSLTVQENIMLPMILEKQKIVEINSKVKQLIKDFNLQDQLTHYPYELSGGQQQRTAICRALVNEPSILLADEPTGNLDSQSAQNVMEALQKAVCDYQTTVLLVTHDVFAASYCDKVIFIKDGQLHTTISSKGDRKQFLQQISMQLTLLGGKGYVF